MASSPFALLFTVSDIPRLLFSWLDRSSLALAACVSVAWRDAARDVRGAKQTRFRLVLADLVSHTSVLVWALENLSKISFWLHENLCGVAALKGALPTLRWAHANRHPRNDESVCAGAAYGGHLDVLQWARENNYSWNSDTCTFAAQRGHLAVLQWASANGCPLNKWICGFAVEGGHLAVLKWARKNGCPWNKTDCLCLATKNGHIDMITWISDQQS